MCPRHQLLKFILFCPYADLAREIAELTALLVEDCGLACCRIARRPQLRAHRYAKVAETPSNVRTACNLPHNSSSARDLGPASVSAVASSL